MRKQIPNIITLLNLFCGTVAVVLAVQGSLDWAFFFVALGIFFDFFDGFFARLLNVKSDLGLQLDSLADMVTSGVVPGIAMFQLLSRSSFVIQTNGLFAEIFPYFGFFITLASAYRLAKFNIDTRQATGFIGLPTPANALFILSLPVILQHYSIDFLQNFLQNIWVLAGITLLSSYMLNAEIPLFALKFKDYSFQNNKVKYIFLIFSVLGLLFFQLIAVPMIIILYVLISIFQNRCNCKL
ncbi:CDP-alcohol phosphatidyltransferase family protein [Capnocytophaga felis]|uniref:Phosphatidylserine synthase n=1 Tax=Capnocytophaga felis TaxID=2267611 RepID=A0A5M4BAT3_9FLAO|nr:CDP-alcohol phosphatidyltransferase family protein [Capnocytophaga felis]GET46256.1 phosphatidylserine synthase [Capnocytophaga felis]GET48205.1 phosphatidylserine synthase [Capnocytophaga felis]